MSALAFMLAAQVGLAEPPQCRAIDAALSVSPGRVSFTVAK